MYKKKCEKLTLHLEVWRQEEDLWRPGRPLPVSRRPPAPAVNVLQAYPSETASEPPLELFHTCA